MEQQLTEGTTTFFTDSEEKITRDMPVFYNPVMKLNRNLTLAVLLAMQEQGATDVRIGLPMEASGVRAARILHELAAPGHLMPKLIAVNDLSEHAIGFAKKNIAHNIGTLDQEMVRFSVNDASMFLRQSKGFDYIDIDPFGTPNPFLDAAVQRISREGILAVTATDTSALAGTYPAATARKYWAVPTRTWVMHDAGLRMLIRKVQLVAAQYETALVPVLSIATDHYYRIFFRRLRSHAAVKDVVRQHAFLHVCTACMQLSASAQNTGQCTGCGAPVQTAGPLWTGALHDAGFVKAARANLGKLEQKTAKELDALLAAIEDECRLSVVGFIDLHELVSRLKIQAPRTEAVLERLGERGCRTHINGAGIKTDLPVAVLAQVLRELTAGTR